MTQPHPEISIHFLKDKPEYTEEVIAWLFQEWSRPRGETLQTRTVQVKRQLNKTRLPVALIATYKGHPAGTVSLRAKDLRTRDKAKPWLSALYVDPKFRSLGVGRALVEATEALALWLGYSELYLFTTDRQTFYHELGWTQLPAVPPEQILNPPCIVFQKPL